MSPVKRVPPDQKVRDDAATRLSDSYLLEAGAGTGKTTVLLDRVKEILKTYVPLEKIAVITFTEKAAGELKLKLRRGMEEMLERSGSDSAWGAHLGRALQSLDRATVSTIHAFAASLLKERPVEANVDPRFTMADPIASAMLLQETWQRWIESEMSAGPPALARALRLGVTLEQVRGLAFAIVEHRDVASGPAPAPHPGGLEAARDRMVEGIRRLSRLSASCRDGSDTALAQIGRLEAALPAIVEASGYRLLLRLQDLPLKTRVGAQKGWSRAEDLAQVRETLADLEPCRDEAVRREKSILAHELADWIRDRDGFLHAYRAAKEDRRLLDFADLLIICRNMLRDSRPARVAFQHRYDCLLVDEFQDTDPLQSEILFLLAADDPEETDWKRARPKPGKLFVVGDPKQSIYRFRRADIEIYEEAKAIIRVAGGVTDQSLTQNFRNVPSIVSWVNDLFEKLIQPQAGAGFQPAYERISPDRDEPQSDRPRGKEASSRVILLLPSDRSALAEATAARVRLAEARHVVALVEKAVADEWPVLDRDASETRPMRYGDVALLFRTSAALETYEDVLRGRSIPYRITGGKRYYLRAEMRALQAVLSAIESPHDPLAVVSALRCAFFGYSDEELLTYAASGGNWAYTQDGAGRGTAFEKAFELLARLHGARNDRPVAATLEEIFEATGALALFCLKPDGDQRAANLLKSIDLARAHESSGGSTFGSFARWLGAMAAEEREEGEAPLTEEAEGEGADEAGGAVRILTVHKAKGLEFPMVVLCDPAGASRGAPPACVVERGAGALSGSGRASAAARLEFCVGSGTLRLESSGYPQAAAREKERLQAEATRLFYVAATRARDYLVLPAFGGKQAAGVYATLRASGFLPEEPLPSGDAAAHRGARLLEGSTLDTSPRSVPPFRIGASEAVPSDPGLIAEKAGWRKALQLALTAPPLGREFRSASGMEQPLAPREGPEATAAHEPRRARALGTAVHGVLARIDLATGRDIGLLSEEEAAATGWPDLAGEVRALVQKALDGKIVREALAARRVFRELPFAAAGDNFITEGRIDLVFDLGGRLTVVDFKTDQVETEAEISSRMATYEPQALIYARALSQIAGLPVTRVVFHFIRPGVARSIKVDEAFLQRGRRLLETGAMQARG